MYIRPSVRRLSRLLIFSLVSLNVLQPLTIHATPSGVLLAGDEPALIVLSLTAKSQFNIAPARFVPDITVVDSGHTRVVKGGAGSVAKVLDEQGVVLGKFDIVQPSLTSPVLPLNTVQITRVTSRLVDEAQNIAFDTNYQNDPSISLGVEKVIQVGKVGSVITHYQVVSHNGVDVSKSIISTERHAALATIILRGSKVVAQNMSTGGASWYDGGPGKLTAAHRTLPFGTKVLVTNQSNGLSVVVTIEDRGPFIGGRIIDLSPDSFAKIAGLGSGVVQVTMTRL